MMLYCITTYAHNFVIRHGETVSIYVEDVDHPVAMTAFSMLQNDINTVLDAKLSLAKTKKKAQIIVELQGKKDKTTVMREGFCLYVDKGKLHVTATDAHGLAYGMMEISQMIGVSPWEWWADCKPRKAKEFALTDGFTKTESPSVAYRGMFINDEDWGLNPWATKHEPNAFTLKHAQVKGAIGPKTNEKIFQLMLRLRMNYYWPAMHECTQPFFLTDGNREMARRYGIYIGGSHCEPMACSTAVEWGVRGKGEYNYVTNAEEVRRFWQQRLNEVKGQDIVYTIGMRGVHDGSMQGTKTREDKLKYLQQVINDQRDMLAATLDRDAAEIPQVFVPYKEVLDIYRDGLQVPDDVTLMWTDDNFGYIRQFPNAQERALKGGNGLYYHASYWGRPHDYLWLATLSPYLMQQQLTEAYKHGIRQMWVLNVGDIKPAEFEIELFSRLAWDGPSIDNTYLVNIYEREFGSALALKIAKVMDKFYRLAWERKPEHLAGTRTEEQGEARKYWSNIHPIDYWCKEDVEKRLDTYKEIADDVERIWAEIPSDRRDAFFQLVKYPVQACAQMNFKFLSPTLCEVAYDSIVSLTQQYNNGFANGGKWNGIMSMKPRGLLVFDKITPEQVPQYPSESHWRTITQPFTSANYGTEVYGLGANGAMLAAEKNKEYTFSFTSDKQDCDSITLRIRLLPNHPIEGNRLTFAIGLDGMNAVSVNYETYDRSEEWKQNVLRNYAERIITLPIDKTKTQHTIRFIAKTGGVVLYDIAFFC